MAQKKKKKSSPGFFIETYGKNDKVVRFTPSQIAKEVQKGTKFGRDFAEVMAGIVKRIQKVKNN